jgi:hypothetical protein
VSRIRNDWAFAVGLRDVEAGGCHNALKLEDRRLLPLARPRSSGTGEKGSQSENQHNAFLDPSIQSTGLPPAPFGADRLKTDVFIAWIIRSCN